MRLNDLRASVQQSFSFHPLAVLLLSITAAITYALWISWHFGVNNAGHQFELLRRWVMIELIYLKYFVWHDFVTSTSGMVLGAVAALLAQRSASSDK